MLVRQETDCQRRNRGTQKEMKVSELFDLKLDYLSLFLLYLRGIVLRRKRG